MHIKHLLIDADHTIFDFDRCQNESLEKAFIDCNLFFLPSYCEIYTVINKLYWKAFEEGKISREQLKEQRFNHFFQQIDQWTDPVIFHQNYVSHLRHSVHYYEGAVEALQLLAKKYSLALITNGLAEVQRPRLEKSGLVSLFKAVLISGEIGWAKPDKEFFSAVFSAINCVDPQHCLVIGDNLHADIQGGLQAGTHTCWFNYQKYLTRANHEPCPHYEVNNWAEVVNLLWQTQ